MPRLSDSMEEGTILTWIVEEGGEVKRGEPLVEIETDKANMTYEADTSGTLIEIVAKEGDTLPIGEVIARIGEAGEKPSKDSEDREEGDEAEPEGDDEEPDEEDAESDREEEETVTESEEKPEPARASDGNGDVGGGSSNGAGERVKASPVARRMARDLGVELAELEGSGPGGRIVKADVEAAAKGDGAPAKPAKGDGAAPEKARELAEEARDKAKDARAKATAAAPGEAEPGGKGRVEVQELSRLQRTVSRRMAESKATAPDYTLHADVDMSLCVELRRRLKEVEDPAPSFNDMVVKACANALREHPRVNGAYRDGHFELYSP